jgi:phosphomannomutase
MNENYKKLSLSELDKYIMKSRNRIFGTDGLRGKVGEYPMNVDFTMRLASAIASTLTPNGGQVADANLIVKSTFIGYSPTLPLSPSVPNILLRDFIMYLSSSDRDNFL